MARRNRGGDEDVLRQSELSVQHEDLRREVDREERAWEFWDQTLADARFAKRIQEIEAGIETSKENMVHADKASHMVQLQADVRARRALLEAFKAERLREPLDKARTALKSFEDEHPLFLKKGSRTPETAGAASGS